MAKKKNVEEEKSLQEPIQRGELIVIVKEDSGIRATPSNIRSVDGADTSSLEKLLKSNKIALTPLFGKNEESILRESATANGKSNEQENVDETRGHLFYYVDAPDAQLEELRDKLLAEDLIDGAYIKPYGEPPIAPDLDDNNVSRDASSSFPDNIEDGAPAMPPNFIARQIYLNSAPAGIDAHYAWGLSGGKGHNVRIIDLEWGWRLNHLDLIQNQGGVLSGTNSSDDNHGTAVLGEYSGDHNNIGISGICPDAWAATVSFSQPTALAIRTAADRLRPGDIMLLEIHRAGPRLNYQGRLDQLGYIAIEWWPDDYEAIRYAINKGVIVVSAAGNGAEDLDSNIYDVKPNGFPSWWKNPFKRNPLDSGSILVGAGAPPPGTHGRNHGTDRSRLGFSNFGSAIDAQGWGREVTTTGYGDLWRDSLDTTNKDKWFTDTFSGTSSASPIIVGALGCIQGYLRAHGRISLTPSRARELLRSTGSPQQSTIGRPSTQRIGNRPNLRQMIQAVSGTNSWVGTQFTGSLVRNQTHRWYTFKWPAHWHVLWTVMPTTPRVSGAQLEWSVQVERASDQYITYWISVKNLTTSTVNFEARYEVLGW